MKLNIRYSRISALDIAISHRRTSQVIHPPGTKKEKDKYFMQTQKSMPQKDRFNGTLKHKPIQINFIIQTQHRSTQQAKETGKPNP